MKFSKIIIASTFLCSSVAQASTASSSIGFDDLTLAPNSFWNGVSNPSPEGTDSTFVSGPATFSNNAIDFGGGFTSWSGWSYSNMKDTTTPGFTNQYSAFTGTGYLSENYGVPFLTSTNDAQVKVSLADPSIVQGGYFTNTTYAALSMLEGDSFAKKFGGASGNDEDWFKLTIRGMDGDNITGEVDFYLADYRFADNSQDYVVDGWEWIDLTSLGTVNGLDFVLSSSDTSVNGINTPAYFALDSLEVTPIPVPAAFLLMGSALFGLMGIKSRQS